MTELTVKALTGGQIKPLLSDLAHLRIKVFKEYPYLHNGSVSYEKTCLKSDADCPESLVVANFYGDLLVGVSTSLRMPTGKSGDIQNTGNW